MPRLCLTRASDAGHFPGDRLDGGARGRANHSRGSREWLGERSAECLRTADTDAGNFEPGFEPSDGHSAHAAESPQQRTGTVDRDPRYGRQHGFPDLILGGFEPLSVCRPIAARTQPASSLGQQVQPERRVLGVAAPEQVDTLPCDRQAGASDRRGADGARIEATPLDQEVRQARRGSKLPNLMPQPAAFKGEMKIDHSLALDERAPSKPVITGRKGMNLYVGSQGEQCFHDPGRSFEDIGDDLTHELAQPARAYGRIGSDVEPVPLS